jgi:uncharacterized membrane protein
MDCQPSWLLLPSWSFALATSQKRSWRCVKQTDTAKRFSAKKNFVNVTIILFTVAATIGATQTDHRAVHQWAPTCNVKILKVGVIVVVVVVVAAAAVTASRIVVGRQPEQVVKPQGGEPGY